MLQTRMEARRRTAVMAAQAAGRRHSRLWGQAMRRGRLHRRPYSSPTWQERGEPASMADGFNGYRTVDALDRYSSSQVGRSGHGERRSSFLRLGMYHPAMSCVGESGISFDFEYSVRMWKHGYRVGLYYAHFVDFTNSRSTGTWSSANGEPAPCYRSYTRGPDKSRDQTSRAPHGSRAACIARDALVRAIILYQAR